MTEMLDVLSQWPWWVYLLLFVALIAIKDVFDKEHTIKHNFPVVGHFRYLLESIGPELRQYIVTNNDEERPFSRDQRRWVYASSKKQNNYFGFGTDNDVEALRNYLIVRHSAFPIDDPQPDDENYDPQFRVACDKILGGYRQRRPQSF